MDKEKILKIYQYTDTKTKKVIYTCKAWSIEQANCEFAEKMGINPIEAPHITCSFWIYL